MTQKTNVITTASLAIAALSTVLIAPLQNASAQSPDPANTSVRRSDTIPLCVVEEKS
jgi:hypothetical protein